MPHSSCTVELIFYPEVEKIARRVRKETRKHREEQSIAASWRLNLEVDLADPFGTTSSDSTQEDVAMANNRTLRKLTAPNLNQQSLCITFPALADNTTFELKFGIVRTQILFYLLLFYFTGLFNYLFTRF